MARFDLRLLGGFTLAGDGVAVHGLGRKSRALIAYLALNAAQSHTREKLAALLWGGTGEAQSRTNLRQALSAIRRALPSGASRFDATGDSISLKIDDLDIDALRFERSCSGRTSEDLEGAMALCAADGGSAVCQLKGLSFDATQREQGPAVLAGEHPDGAWRLQAVDHCKVEPEYHEFISVAR